MMDYFFAAIVCGGVFGAFVLYKLDKSRRLSRLECLLCAAFLLLFPAAGFALSREFRIAILAALFLAFIQGALYFIKAAFVETPFDLSEKGKPKEKP